MGLKAGAEGPKIAPVLLHLSALKHKTLVPGNAEPMQAQLNPPPERRTSTRCHSPRDWGPQ